MRDKLLHGQKVCLTAENPAVMAAAFARWELDTKFFRLFDTEPLRLSSEKKIKEGLEQNLDKDEPGNISFAIQAIEDSKMIGFIGLFALSWKDRDALVAIGIGERTYWGKGYGTEAMDLLLEYAFLELNLRRIGLIVFEYNTRAIRSYEKCGFIPEGRIRGAIMRDGQRWDWLVMGLLREEWEARQKELV